MDTDGTSALAVVKLDAREVAEWAKLIQQSIIEIRKTVLHEGSDYGKIPGTNKDVLLKPGAEKMSSAFKLYPVPKLLTSVEDWQGGFFFYRYQIEMVHRETGQIWGTGIGSCNSREKKYAWRWVPENELPEGIDKDTLLKENGAQTLTEFDFAVKKAETTGQYGKPVEHWQMFKDAIASGTARQVQKETKRGMSPAWEITAGVVRYRIANPEICDLVNTIDKMAYKRAYVAAVLIATNASEFFTQDMEDFISLALPKDNVIEAQYEDIAPVTVEAQRMTPPPATLMHWSDNPSHRQTLVDTAIGNRYLTPGQTWTDLLRLADLTEAQVKDLPTGGALGTIVKEKGEALKLELAKAQVSTDKAAQSLGSGGERRIGEKPAEPAITDLEAQKLLNGSATGSPFDTSKPQANPFTGKVESIQPDADAAKAAGKDLSSDDIPF